MKRNILNSACLMSGIFFLASCAPKTVVVVPPPVTSQVQAVATPDKKAENLALLEGKNFTYNTLSLKGKARLDIDGEENNVNINVRIKDKEIIWVSVSAVIGEVARVLITPDSIKIINRLQTTYTKKPFSFIQEFTGEKVTFPVLQAVLSGNLISEFITPETRADLENGVWVIKGSNGALDYRFMFNTLLRVGETNLNDVESAQALKVVYENYQQLSGLLFPSLIRLNSQSGTKKINIELNFSSIEGNVPLDFPFTVKPRFKVIN